MTKNQLLLVSLLAAIPGAVLVILMIMSFLSYADKSPGAFKGLAGFALIMGLGLVLMPVGIFMKLGKPKAPVEPKRKSEDEEKPAAPLSHDSESEVSEAVDQDEEEVEVTADSSAEGEEDNSSELEPLEEDDMMIGTDEFNVDSMSSDGVTIEDSRELEIGSDLDLDSFEETEEMPPKKKK